MRRPNVHRRRRLLLLRDKKGGAHRPEVEPRFKVRHVGEKHGRELLVGIESGDIGVDWGVVGRVHASRRGNKCERRKDERRGRRFQIPFPRKTTKVLAAKTSFSSRRFFFFRRSSAPRRSCHFSLARASPSSRFSQSNRVNTRRVFVLHAFPRRAPRFAPAPRGNHWRRRFLSVVFVGWTCERRNHTHDQRRPSRFFLCTRSTGKHQHPPHTPPSKHLHHQSSIAKGEFSGAAKLEFSERRGPVGGR